MNEAEGYPSVRIRVSCLESRQQVLQAGLVSCPLCFLQHNSLTPRQFRYE